MADEQAIGQAARLIERAERIAVLTGAGVSKESGVPTFRDALDGLWARYDPQQLATPEAFRANPKLVWDWYEYRRSLVRQAQPNPGHVALAQLQARKPGTVVITQNVDDLHERAGSREVLHLHGNIAGNRCFADCRGNPTPIDISALDWADDSLPACPDCGAWVRPDIVWFGEALPQPVLDRAFDLAQACDLMIVVGTSGLVTPAALLPDIATSAGARLIEVNPDTTRYSAHADVKLSGGSGELLPRVLAGWGAP